MGHQRGTAVTTPPGNPPEWLTWLLQGEQPGWHMGKFRHRHMWTQLITNAPAATPRNLRPAFLGWVILPVLLTACGLFVALLVSVHLI